MAGHDRRHDRYWHAVHAWITFTPRGRHAIFDADEIDLLEEIAQRHRLGEDD